MARLGLPPPVFSLNRFPDDDAAEVAAVQARLQPLGVTVVQGRYFADGGAGAVDLADAVMARLAAEPSDSAHYRAPYALDGSIPDKIAAVARVVLGADGAVLHEKAQADLALLERLGGGGLPVCLAKTHLSISDDAKVQGRPGPYTLTVTGLRLSAGAGFVVALCGSIVTMPGLPKEPQAWHIDVVKGEGGIRRIVGIK
jgi:formate--tetrahydrofolate ligase